MARRTGRVSSDADARPLSAAEFAALFEELAAGATPILVAVSGGPDSTALMHGLAVWAAEPGRPRLIVATVDHGLRPEARAEAEAVATAAAGLGIPHRILTWSPPPGRVSQEGARKARYGLLLELARETDAGTLVTAHTQDDQAETLLMRAAAGSGLSGLAGMRRVVARGPLRHLRPLLDIPKARLVATCHVNGWAFIQDPSNANPAYARARWRRLAPLLAAEGLDAARLAALASRLRRADEALDVVARAALARTLLAGSASVATLDLAALACEPEEICLRVLALALAATRSGHDEERSENGSPSLRLERLEACSAALRAALAERKRLRRTLAGRQLTLDSAGRLTIEPEPIRWRGAGLWRLK